MPRFVRFCRPVPAPSRWPKKPLFEIPPPVCYGGRMYIKEFFYGRPVTKRGGSSKPKFRTAADDRRHFDKTKTTAKSSPCSPTAAVAAWPGASPAAPHHHRSNRAITIRNSPPNSTPPNITPEIEALRRIRNAGKKPRYWRAAAWLLERTNPRDFARRTPTTFSEQDAANLAMRLADPIVCKMSNKDFDEFLDRLYNIMRTLSERNDLAKLPADPPATAARLRRPRPRRPETTELCTTHPRRRRGGPRKTGTMGPEEVEREVEFQPSGRRFATVCSVPLDP